MCGGKTFRRALRENIISAWHPSWGRSGPHAPPWLKLAVSATLAVPWLKRTISGRLAPFAPSARAQFVLIIAFVLETLRVKTR